MSFWNAIATCFRKYAVFQGRASRPEYWWFTLFVALVWLVSLLIYSSPATGHSYRDTDSFYYWVLLAVVVLHLLPFLRFLPRS